MHRSTQVLCSANSPCALSVDSRLTCMLLVRATALAMVTPASVCVNVYCFSTSTDRQSGSPAHSPSHPPTHPPTLPLMYPLSYRLTHSSTEAQTVKKCVQTLPYRPRTSVLILHNSLDGLLCCMMLCRRKSYLCQWEPSARCAL